MVDCGTVLPAQSCIDADHYDTSDLRPAGKDYYTIDGVLYPASINLSSPLLYYNKNHFRRAGLDPDKPPTTLDELRDVRPEDQGRGRRRHAARAEPQLVVHRDVAHRRTASRS